MLRTVKICLAVLVVLLGSGVAWANRASNAAATRKFARVASFKGKMPRMRQRVTRQLAKPALDQKTAVAAIVRIMDTTFMRVGSERYAKRDKPSFGASSLRKSQVRVVKGTVYFSFRGKSGVEWERSVKDPKLAKAVKLFLAQPGDRLFSVATARGTRAVTEVDIRDFLRDFGGKPKDLRTYHANRLISVELKKFERPSSRRQADKQVKTAIQNVAAQLGHTPAVCRSSYLDRRVLEAYAQGL